MVIAPAGRAAAARGDEAAVVLLFITSLPMERPRGIGVVLLARWTLALVCESLTGCRAGGGAAPHMQRCRGSSRTPAARRRPPRGSRGAAVRTT